jgi:hypothetical protein
LIAAGAWKAKIAWPRKPKKAPPHKKVSRGGGRSYVGEYVKKTECFLF